MQQKTPPAPEAFLRRPEVLQRTQIGSTNWEAGIKSGKYPAPIFLSPRVRVWRESVINQLVAAL